MESLTASKLVAISNYLYGFRPSLRRGCPGSYASASSATSALYGFDLDFFSAPLRLCGEYSFGCGIMFALWYLSRYFAKLKRCPNYRK